LPPPFSLCQSLEGGDGLDSGRSPEDPHGGSPIPLQPASHGVDITCSTRYAKAPSSPGRGGDFFSAPASPMHFVRSSFPYTSAKPPDAATDVSASGPCEFEFSARGSMTSADKLFLNGKIWPMRLSAHLQRPQIMAPFLDLEAEEDEEGKEGETERTKWAAAAGKGEDGEPEGDRNPRRIEDAEPSGSGWSSRSSSISSTRSSRKWISLKDILYRSKSEGRGDLVGLWAGFNLVCLPEEIDIEDLFRRYRWVYYV
ncbi:hypothetical protein Taro_008757, partial [Colocasia esculenta]|nr:hypothetical protein [Colocasia esculenta]